MVSRKGINYLVHTKHPSASISKAGLRRFPGKTSSQAVRALKKKMFNFHPILKILYFGPLFFIKTMSSIACWFLMVSLKCIKEGVHFGKLLQIARLFWTMEFFSDKIWLMEVCIKTQIGVCAPVSQDTAVFVFNSKSQPEPLAISKRHPP